LLENDKPPKRRAAVKLSAARGKTMDTEVAATKKEAEAPSPAPARKRSRSDSRSRGRSSTSSTSSSSSSSSSKKKNASSSSSPLGPFLSSLTVPQGWFLHFYALGGVSATAVLGAALRGGGEGGGGGGGGRNGSLSSNSSSPSSSLPPPSSVAALSLLLLHVLRRWAECSWQASWPRGSQMHAVAYAFGMSYYAVLPLSLLPAGAFAAAAAAVRGEEAASKSTQGVFASLLSKIGISASLSPPPSSLKHPASLIFSAFASLPLLRLVGVAVFALGTFLQAASHAAFASLQKKAAASNRQYLPPGSSQDHPRVLSLCACPHYLGEIVIYLGLALVAAGGFSFSFSPSSSSSSSILTNELSAGILPLLVLVWVSVNLVLASAENKRWYRSKFPKEFPEGRAALVPGVF